MIRTGLLWINHAPENFRKEQAMNETPNVVIESPATRRVLNRIIGWGAITLGLAQAVDGATPAFDLTAWTIPATAGIAFLAGVLAVGVTVPNIPRPGIDDL